jgi:hypothetical protein
MLTHRPVKKFLALTLAAGALVAATEAGAAVVGGQCGVGTADTQGDPNALPPILRAAQPSELAEIRLAEAQQQSRFHYRPPAGARYSLAEMDAFAASAVH